MFRFTRKPSSGSHRQYLAKITHLVQCGYAELVQTMSVLWLHSTSCEACVHSTTHNTHNKHPCPRQDSNPRSQQASGPQTFALDCAATGTGLPVFCTPHFKLFNHTAYIYKCLFLSFHGPTPPRGPRLPSSRGFENTLIYTRHTWKNFSGRVTGRSQRITG